MEAVRIIDRRQKGHGGESSHAWYGHQATAGRAFADLLEYHFVKDRALLPEGGARDEHGAHHRFQVRRLGYKNAGFKWAGCDPTVARGPLSQLLLFANIARSHCGTKKS